ncbi:MAG: radical SAM family heme chaperone HemW [Flavobacteriaceae bacterium]|nr:radical SAM family heme chaperone HemW [Flavobacteriaceae bacterium]
MHLYIHIPYCKQQCSYCNFHFSTVFKTKSQMLAAICKEMQLRQHQITTPLQTIYLGGGTPSILNINELGRIFNQIENLFEIENKAEITIEANPDDLNAQKLKELLPTPINRFSIGVQSFFDEDLALMNRAHTVQQAESSVKRVQDAGFENITIDLIYGSPTTTDQMWKTNLQKAIELNVPHISSYALTIEPKTMLHHQIKTGKQKNIDESNQFNQFHLLSETLVLHGFEHYEISNFAKPGFQSKHNSAYWKGHPYIGIGPSAHSFSDKSRSWNIANNSLYIEKINQGQTPSEIETLSETEIANELTMIGLRTNYGIDITKIEQLIFGKELEDWHQNAKKLIQEGKLILHENQIKLAPEFRFFADGIASEMFIV